MWLYNNPPRRELKEKYGFDAETEWLNHVQKSSVRFNSGGSGSFVSPDGLVMSNHHVGADALQKFGDKDHNYTRDGFYAVTPGDEKRCFDLELNVLISIEDVTERVRLCLEHIPAERLSLVPDCGFFPVSRWVAFEKLKRLAAGVALARKRLSG